MPTIAWQLIEHPDFAKYDTSSLENFSYGGAPAAADLVRRLKTAVPASQLATAWGMTETSAPFTIVIGEDYETHPTTCGYAMPVGDMRIVGANGEDMPLGRGRRTLGARAECGQGLLAQSGGDRGRRSAAAGCAPATSPSSTRRASATSSTAPRTC